jgi:hypothetical protein
MAYNIFKRPSFRKGGIASMDTRQRYGQGDFVKKIEDLMAARKEEYQKSAQPTAGELALAVASAIGRKPGGNIGEIAGELSKDLMPLYLKKKEAKAKIAGQDIEDLISVEKIKAYKDRFSTTGGVTGYKLGQYRQLLAKLQKQGKFAPGQKGELGMLLGSKVRSDYQIRNDFLLAKKDDPMFSSLSDAEKEKQIQNFVKSANEALLNSLIDRTIIEKEAENKSTTSSDDPAIEDAINSLGKANGGRIGYAEGSMVQNQTKTTQTSMTTDQGKSKDSRYQELRDRLPAEITDDVVQLIAYNSSAFQDFASIQSQADIDNFNQRYGVTLAVPMNT